MIEEEKLDPDQLLKAIEKEESQQGLGKLKIFFGMSAGVGKTYTMLEDGKQRLQEGVQVVVGVVNTHGRKETEALLEGLQIIPEKWVKYRDNLFSEFDIDKVLELKPQLVLVDELAHTNVPGSKHPKRWQDVIELLDAGIDVYTTLNVQHVESRKDIIESITGIQIRETIPDLILERAAMIEMIDIPPQELLKRLKEGKVYLGDQALAAAQNFFKEDNLTALREIALRLTAEKVDHDLHGILALGKGWKTREKLMVAISSAPSSEQLIRASRRLAFELDSPWIALYVDKGDKLSQEDQRWINKHLNLAQELGAEVVTTQDLDVAAAIQRIAKQKDVTRIVIGRSKPWSFKYLFRKSLIERLEQENKHIDLLILRQDRLVSLYQKTLLPLELPGSFPSYGIAIVTVAFCALLGYFLDPLLGYKAVGLIFLLGILILSLFVTQGPVFLAAILSSLTWDLLFIPPLFHSGISAPEDIALVFLYFCAASIMGILTTRLRKQNQFLSIREEKMERLYEVIREIAKAPNYHYLRLNVSSFLKTIFGGEFDILTEDEKGQLLLNSRLPLLNLENERSAAKWAFQKGKIAGFSTDTLASAEGVYFPIKFSREAYRSACFPTKVSSASFDG